MIEILMKILVKIAIIVVENREPYYFIINYKCGKGPLSLFFNQMLPSTLTRDEQYIYYNVYAPSSISFSFQVITTKLLSF